MAAGGAVGAVARYAATEAFADGTGFPWTTFAINVSGSTLPDCICHTITGKPIKPKTMGQKKYIDAIRDKMIVFVWTGRNR